MEDLPLTDDSARTMRELWFTFLDEMEPSLGALHGYAMKLTGNVWDAEDLVQDTLLRGFAMAARGDFHGPDSPVRDVRAYLFRTATNLWIDRLRRVERPVAELGGVAAAAAPDPAEVRRALGRAAARTTPKEFAALVLKEGFDFSLADIGDFLGTTPGTVKSLLSRGRRRLQDSDAAAGAASVEPERVDAFAVALNDGDVDRVMALMAEFVKIDVCNVGGGRGRSGVWTARTLAGSRFESARVDGQPVMLIFPAEGADLSSVVRLESDGDVVTRIVDYTYAPETLGYVAAQLGLAVQVRGRHQVEALPDMIATTTLPWRESG